ncbi:MAG: metallophosphoesterase family protein [Phycisphaeraceae bacterium]|nr:metallophosphoesterase family protein [Phycisphaeraceae bacterium]
MSHFFALSLALTLFWTLLPAQAQDVSLEHSVLPVKVPQARLDQKGIRNPLTFAQVRNIIGVSKDGTGLLLDLQDESLFGTVYSGPYPFEAQESDYDTMRFRLSKPIVKGRGVIPCADFIKQTKINANDWPLPHMTVAYRLELYQRRGDSIKSLGFYDSLVSIREQKASQSRNGKGSIRIQKTLTLVEGPFVSLLNSDDPTRALLAWQTDQASTCLVHIQPEGSTLNSPTKPATQWTQKPGPDGTYYQHEMRLTNLAPNTNYTYSLHCQTPGGDSAAAGPYTFRTASLPGEGKVVFAFVSDSREGVGGGEEASMGHNAKVLKYVAQDAYRKGAQFFIVGGDLVNGYTTATEDFRLQMRGWKQSLSGFWRTRPVYPVMGNHEALLNLVDGISFDKWPYATDSAEAVFADNFWNPTNGPTPSDARRPTYKENVYSFQNGPVLCIGYNNNYWWTSNNKCATVGGCPEGYLLEDQLQWIEAELARAEQDATIKYILVYGQEPVFPCGGHVNDCMWWNGNNTLRAHTYTDGKIVPETTGMIDVRNRFWGALAHSTKVAAVLAGDEHEYHRLRVDQHTPVGVMALDDTNGNNKLDDGRISPNPDFTHAVWQIVAGTAGAPYYAREDTPWKPSFLSSQAGYCLFEADDKKISLTYYTVTGQKLDYVEDLMANK